MSLLRFFRGMEPIYVQSNQYQKSGSDPGSEDANAYTLTLSQAVLPDRADEIARVVARSPIDRLEHAFEFDDGNDYLAWSVATNAQRKAGHLGYDPTKAGIESVVIAPMLRGYGRLDEFFSGQAPMTPTRLVISKQNQCVGDNPIRDNLGPDHRSRFVGLPSNEQTARSAGRTFLDDLIKAYSQEADKPGQIRKLLDDTHHPYAYSKGFVKGHLASEITSSTPRIDRLAQVQLPEGYSREDYYADVNAIRSMMKDMASQARSEGKACQYDVASQAFGFASDLSDLYDHLCSGRLPQAFASMGAISPYLIEDLPHRLYENLELQIQPSTAASPSTPTIATGMRYTRVDLEGKLDHYASMIRPRKDGEISDTIEVEVLCPNVAQRTHHVQAGADAREDQQSMAEGLQQMLDGYKGDKHAVNEYYDAIIRLAD